MDEGNPNFITDPVPELQRLLGSPVVFLRWPRGVKGSPKPWGHLKLTDMTPDYLANLKSGNIGVALGEKSGGLCAIDLDFDDLIEPFLRVNPMLANTLQTRGARGRVFWVRFRGEYPQKTTKLKTQSGDPADEHAGEFRSSGSQSIIWGRHPKGHDYQFVVRKPALVIEFNQIHWPEEIRYPFKSCTYVADGADVTDETHEAEVADEAGTDVVLPRAHLYITSIASVEDAVAYSLPTRVHDNDSCLFKLARGLLTLTANGLEYDSDQAFELWYAGARSRTFLRPEETKDDYYLKFLNACERAKVPLGSKQVGEAWHRAKQNLLPIPPKALPIAKPEFHLLVAFFREMQAGAGPDSDWFVAGGQRTCAKLLDHKNHTTVEHWIGAMLKMGFLKQTKDGGMGRSTRFRYLGPLS